MILDLRTHRYLSLNRSGSLFWPLLVEGTSEARLVEALAAAYGIDRSQAAHDVQRVVGQFHVAGLLIEAGGESASGRVLRSS